MKSAIKLAGLFFMFTCTMLILLDLQGVSVRSEQLEESVSIALRNTLKGSNISPMYEMDKQDMRSEFIRDFARNVNTDGDFDVVINEADEKGIMDVKVRNYFIHNNGKDDVREVRKTLLVETLVDE